MFHRVDDPLGLPSSRFFQMAERLPVRGGAVAAALAADLPAEVAPDQPVAPGSGGGPVVLDDVRTVAGMTSDSGFPGIEYSGG